MIKCLLTELGRAGRENNWPSVMAHGPRCAQSVHHDLGATQSISTYYPLDNSICVASVYLLDRDLSTF